jgi:hypothetical protein
MLNVNMQIWYIENWFQTFTMFWMLYSFGWFLGIWILHDDVSKLCQLHLHRWCKHCASICMSQQSFKFSAACLKAIFFSLRLIQVLENSLSREINVAGVHKYLVSFTVLKTLLYFFNTQLDLWSCFIHTGYHCTSTHLSLWCTPDLFLHHTCQVTATMNCLVCVCWEWL